MRDKLILLGCCAAMALVFILIASCGQAMGFGGV